MMTVGDINNVTFEKAMRGYRPEDVDDFLAKMAQEFEALTNERDEALGARESAEAEALQIKEDAEKKLYILAEKIEQYRADEDNLKMTLLNAQRMGDTVVNEAKQKAETLIYEAKTRAAQVHEEMKTQALTEEATLATLRKEVSKFRTEILEMYRRHAEVIAELPVCEDKAAVSMAAAFHSEPKAATPKKAPVFVKEEPVAAASAQIVPETEPARGNHGAGGVSMPEVEQPSFDSSLNASTSVESFENYQGISFEE